MALVLVAGGHLKVHSLQILCKKNLEAGLLENKPYKFPNRLDRLEFRTRKNYQHEPMQELSSQEPSKEPLGALISLKVA